MPLSFSGGEFSHIYALLDGAAAAVIFEFQQLRGNDTRANGEPDIRLYDDLKYSCEKYHLCHSELDGNSEQQMLRAASQKGSLAAGVAARERRICQYLDGRVAGVASPQWISFAGHKLRSLTRTRAAKL